jgi:hypothetical protein
MYFWPAADKEETSEENKFLEARKSSRYSFKHCCGLNAGTNCYSHQIYDARGFKIGSIASSNVIVSILYACFCADAGSKWSNGQRKSTRIRSKPLEWWRGEKMLYGRVHSSKGR